MPEPASSTPSTPMHKFVPLLKVDEVRREVWGIATQEAEDRSGETLDYETSAPLFRAWSADFEKQSNGKSKGNIREMHGPHAAGRVIDMQFNDAQKTIVIGTHIVDDSSWAKVQAGVLTGFSIGGKYAKVFQKNGKTYYTGDPSEISLVDMPCLATAVFEVVKADGSTDFRKFDESVIAKPPAPFDVDDLASKVAAKMAKRGQITKSVNGEDLTADAFAYVPDAKAPDTWKLPIRFADVAKTRQGVRKALVVLGDKRKSVRKNFQEEMFVAAGVMAGAVADELKIPHGDDWELKVKESFDFRTAKAAEARGLKKDLYAVGTFATVLQSLYYLYRQAVYEADVEGDGSAVPAALGAHLDELAETFIMMAEEEVSELTADAVAKGDVKMANETDGLLKAASKATLAKSFKNSAANNGAFATLFGEMSKALGDFSKAAAGNCPNCDESVTKSQMTDMVAGAACPHCEKKLNNDQKAAKKAHVELFDSLSASNAKVAGHFSDGAAFAQKMVKALDEDEAVAKAADVELDGALTKAAPVTTSDTAPVVGGTDFGKAMDDLRVDFERKALEKMKSDPDVIAQFEKAAKEGLLEGAKIARPAAQKIARAGAPDMAKAISSVALADDGNTAGPGL